MEIETTLTREQLGYIAAAVIAFALFALYTARRKRDPAPEKAAPGRPVSKPVARARPDTPGDAPAPEAGAVPEEPPGGEAETPPGAQILTGKPGVAPRPAGQDPEGDDLAAVQADIARFQRADRLVARENGAGPPAAETALAGRVHLAESGRLIAALDGCDLDAAEKNLAGIEADLNAFLAKRGARLDPDYLALRRRELRLTHAAQQHERRKSALRAELARIKRREVRLARDIDRAEAEEARLIDALARAKAKAQRATGDAAFEAEARVGKLTRDLEATFRTLTQARAMARTGTAGHVFVLTNERSLGANVVLIGSSRRASPETHIAELGLGLPYPFEIAAMVFDDDAEALCDRVRDALAPHVLDPEGASRPGFFRIDAAAAQAALEHAAGTGTGADRTG